MLLESDVIRAVCAKLKSQGYQIVQQLAGTQHGDDILAIKRTAITRELRVEAKGDASLKPGSERGGPVAGADPQRQVADALYQAAVILSKQLDGVEIRAAIALPDNPGHRTAIRKIEPIVSQLSIAVFWVKVDGTVQVASPWAL